jgi:transglutaminase-like putative cysteine protease
MSRIAITAAVAVIVASLSMSSVIANGGWIVTGIGAVVIVAAAGALTRLPRLPAAVVATFLVLIAVVPLLTLPSWTDRIGALVILVITALSATGAWPLRGFAVLACYVAALLLYLNLAFAHASSIGYLIPSDNSIEALARLWHGAFAEFRYSPPVPDSPPVSFVAAVGTGAVAIAVDILAVRLRRPAVAGLPLLLLFSVPVASNLKVFDAPELVVFAASLAGYLALLSADGRERLRMWGRLVTFRHVQSADETGSGPDTRELSASGRRIGLAAVCLAIVIPVVLPSMRVRDVFNTTADGGGQAGPGVGGGAALSPLLSVGNVLQHKPKPVLSYKTNSPNPHEQYFQVYVVNYSARQNNWLPPSYSDSKPVGGDKLPLTAQGATSTTPVSKVTTTIKINGTAVEDDGGAAVLPMPYAPYQLHVYGDDPGWHETAGTLMVFNSGGALANLRYSVQSDEITRAANIEDAQPPAGIEAEYGTYTGPDSAQLTAIADAHTSGATSELQEAEKLEDWFQSPAFKYTLKPNLPERNWLLPFLTKVRSGYCVQFAWAFAILAKTLGIPARIAIGYTGGTQGSDGNWDVTTADAHAWPELYFFDYGWLRFEPTPSGSHGQGTATVPVYAGVRTGSSGANTNVNPHNAGLGPAGGVGGLRSKVQLNRGLPSNGSGAASATKRASGAMGLAIGIPLAVFLLIAWPALTRLFTRRRRWLSASGDAAIAHAAWRELTDDLADYGLGCAPGETPRAVAKRVTRQASLDETATRAVGRLAAAEERARYARSPEPGAGLKAAEVIVRRAVAASVPRQQRLRARLVPASTVQAARHLLQRGNEMLSWLDSSWPTFQRQLRRAAAHRAG